MAKFSPLPALAGTLVLVAAALSAPTQVRAQAPATDPEVATYFRAVGQYFRVPPDEVAILAEWSLPPEEIPVVLFLSRRGGVSADALIALKRQGSSWFELGARYGLDAGAFYLPLEPVPQAGSLGPLYQRMSGRARGDWGGVALQDDEVVALVNCRLLSEMLNVAPERALETADRSGSWVRAYLSLSR